MRRQYQMKRNCVYHEIVYNYLFSLYNNWWSLKVKNKNENSKHYCLVTNPTSWDFQNAISMYTDHGMHSASMYHVNKPERLIEYTYTALKGSPSKRSSSKRSPSKRSPHKRNPYNTSQSNTTTSKRSRSVSRLVGKTLSRTHGVPPFNRQLSIFSAGKSPYANPKAMSSSSSKDKKDDSKRDKNLHQKAKVKHHPTVK